MHFVYPQQGRGGEGGNLANELVGGAPVNANLVGGQAACAAQLQGAAVHLPSTLTGTSPLSRPSLNVPRRHCTVLSCSELERIVLSLIVELQFTHIIYGSHRKLTEHRRAGTQAMMRWWILNPSTVTQRDRAHLHDTTWFNTPLGRPVTCTACCAQPPPARPRRTTASGLTSTTRVRGEAPGAIDSSREDMRTPLPSADRGGARTTRRPSRCSSTARGRAPASLRTRIWRRRCPNGRPWLCHPP